MIPTSGRGMVVALNSWQLCSLKTRAVKPLKIPAWMRHELWCPTPGRGAVASWWPLRVGSVTALQGRLPLSH